MCQLLDSQNSEHAASMEPRIGFLLFDLPHEHKHMLQSFEKESDWITT